MMRLLPLGVLLFFACRAGAQTAVSVGSATDLVSALTTVDDNPSTSYTITFTANVTLTSSSTDTLPALVSSSTVTINGAGYTLDGGGVQRGFLVYSGAVTIENLTISDTQALGGSGGPSGGGGGGAGLGGALFVANGANVTVSNVTFSSNSAVGGTGTGGGSPGGGGGGMGGNGGSPGANAAGTGGGGLGLGANGGTGDGNGSSATNGSSGIAVGLASAGSGGNSGGTGGSAGGGGGGGRSGFGGGTGGGGGGIGGATSQSSGGSSGGIGGFGGGGGGADGSGGAGGFGGGGGSSSTTDPGGAGGFGGGGGGSALTAGAGGFGGGNANDKNGGGGAGMGGAIFVQQGGSLTLAGTLTVNGSTVTAGTGAGSAGSGSAFGAGLFLQGSDTNNSGSGSLTFEPGSGVTETIADVIADQTGSGGTGGSAGAWTLVKSGAGTLVLSATNTYSGGTTVSSGLINFNAAGNFGSGTITLNGGGLQWASATTTDISGQLAAIGSGGGTFDTNGNNVTLATGLSGSGGVTLADSNGTPGTLTLTAADSSTGGTTITSGTLELGTGGSLASTGALAVNGGTFDLNGHSQTVGALSGTGGSITLGSGTLTAGDSSNTTLTSVISGSGGFVKQGSGALTLAGTNTYSGGTSVSGGTLEVTGSLGDSAVTVSSGGTLEGTGTVKSLAVQSGGTLSGNLTSTDAASLASGATFSATLSGASSYTTLAAPSVDLSGAPTLSVALGGGYTPAVGATFTLISATPTGTFSGLANGATFSSGGVSFRINYSGNVTLTALIAAPAITSAGSASGTVGSAFSYSITATNSPTGYSLVSGSLPAGLSLDALTGIISGTPTAAGTSDVSIGATNGTGTGTLALSIAIGVPAAPVITVNSGSGSGVTATIGQGFSYQISASSSPTSYSASGLPPGLSINASTGVISGTPTGAPGSYSVTLSATNAGGTANAALTLIVSGGTSTYTPYTFTTLAGQTTPGDADGTGTAAEFLYPAGVASDGLGTVYVADTGNDTIRQIGPGAVVKTVAGTAAASGSTDGTGVLARFNMPEGVTVGASGNLYVADTGNDTIRMVTPSGVVTTFAGSAGSQGSVDGIGTAARFSSPAAIAVDSSGNLYVADTGNDTIRKITPAGVVTTLAGTAGSAGSSDGTGSAAQFSAPGGVAVDASGNVFVADTGNNTIREISPSGVVTTVAGFAGGTGFNDGMGVQALFNSPSGIAVDASDNLYVSDWGNDTVRRVTSAGVVTTLAGSPGASGSADGAGSAARFNDPYGIAVDPDGLLVVADAQNCEIRLGGAASALAEITTQPQSTQTTLGGFFSFSVAVQSSTPVAYQWMFNGAALAGQVSSSLTIGNAQAADAGSYTVVVTNAAGSVTSSAATLTLNAAASSAPAPSGGGGGGAPSLWFLSALAAIAAARRMTRRPSRA